MVKEDLFVMVRETRAILKEYSLGDRASAHHGVSKSTADDYAKIARARLDLDAEYAGRLMDGVTRQSWDKVRAALLHETARICVDQQRRCDVYQRAWRAAQTDQDREEAFALASEAARLANKAGRAFMWVSVEQPPPDRSRPKASKRRSLPAPKLSEDWRAQAYDAASNTRRPAFAVLWAGARPAEIEKGVEVEFGRDGTVIVRIRGAKTGTHSGQELRILSFDLGGPVGQALSEHAGPPGRPTVVQRSATRLNKDFAAMRTRKLLPKRISPYSMRHQFCADLKSDGWSPDQIAQAMGHASARSQGNYGSVKQGRGGLGLRGVEATRVVRTDWNRGTRPGPVSAPDKPGDAFQESRPGL